MKIVKNFKWRNPPLFILLEIFSFGELSRQVMFLFILDIYKKKKIVTFFLKKRMKVTLGTELVPLVVC